MKTKVFATILYIASLAVQSPAVARDFFSDLSGGGFAIDRKESTRRAVKFRRDDDIVIVIHEGGGSFDARSDAKGDVFALASYLNGSGFEKL